MIIGSIEIQLMADVARLQKDMDEAKRMVGGAMTSMESHISSVKSALGGLAMGAGVGAFGAWVKGAIDAADSLNDLSDATSIAVEQLAGLKLAAKLSGSDLEGTAAAINKLSQNIGKDAEKYAKLGISSKDPIEAYKQLADVFSKIEDPQTRAAFGSEALGKSWASAAPMLSQGGEKMGELIDRGTSLSGMTKENIKQAGVFNDRLDELGFAVGGVATAIGTNLLPVMNVLIDGMADNAAEVAKMEGAFSTVTNSLKVFTIGASTSYYILERLGKGAAGFTARLSMMAKGDFEGASQLAKIMNEDYRDAAESYGNFVGKVWDAKATTQGLSAETGEASKKTRELSESQQKALHAFIQTEKSVKAVKTEYTLGQDAAKEYAKYVADLQKAQTGADESTLELTASQKTMRAALSSPFWEQMSAGMQQVIVQQFQLAVSAEEEAKAFLDAKKANEDYLKALNASLSGLEQEAYGLERQVETYGQSRAQIELETIAKLENAKATAVANGANEDAIAYYEKEIDLRRRIAQASGQKDAFDAQAEGWRSVENVAHQTFTSIFDSGKSTFDRLRDTLKNGLYDLLYQMTVKQWIIQISGSVSGSGVSGSAFGSQSGGLGSVSGLFNNLSGIGNFGASLFGSASAYGSVIAPQAAAAGSQAAMLAAQTADFVTTSAGSQAAMLAAQTSEFGAAGLAATAESAGLAASGTLTTLASAAPYIAAALIAAQALGAFDHGGPKTEVYGGARDVSWGLAGSAPQSSAMDAIASGVQKQFDDILSKFGTSASLKLGIGGDADPSGKAGSRSGYYIDVNGQSRFSEVGVSSLDNATLAATASRALLSALEATDINKVVDTYLNSLDIQSLTAEQASAAVQTVQAFQSVQQAMADMGFGAGSLSTELVGAMGGIGNLQTALGSYYDSYFSAEEKADAVRKQVVQTFEDLNLQMPETRAGFRALLESLVATGGESSTTAARLLGISAAFGSVADAAASAQQAAQEAANTAQQVALDNVASARTALIDAYQREQSALSETQAKFAGFAKSLASFRADLQMGDLSPLTAPDKYAQAKSAFESISTRAKLGDESALADLQSSAQAFLQASRGMFASGSAYNQDYASVLSVLDSTESLSARQARLAGDQLAELQSQTSALGQINDSVLTLAAAQAALSQSLLALVTQDNGPMALYNAAKGAGVSMSTLDSLAGWSPGTSAAWAASQGLPAFASGGLHAGGLRLVGERGPEIEATGPARYWSAEQTSQMVSGGNAELVAEVKALRAEVAALRQQQAREHQVDAAVTAQAAERSAQTITSAMTDAVWRAENKPRIAA